MLWLQIPLFTEEVLIQKSGHGESECFLYSFHPCPGFSCFISLFCVTSCYKNISSLRARTSLSSYSLARGRCSEILVEETSE